MQGEVVGFRRPLRLYGGTQHGRQVPLQLDLKRLAVLVWREHDGVYEAAQRLGRLRPAVRFLERCGELCDLGAVDPGHLWMQQRGRLVGGGEFGLQRLTPSGVRVQLVLHLAGGNTLHDGLDELLASRFYAFDLALGSGQPRAVLHPEPVHLTSELVAELLEQLLVQQLVLEGLEDSGFYLVAPDREAVAAGALLTSSEARETVAAGHDEPCAADTALRQPGEQILRPSCEADVAGACNGAPRCALTVLRGVPKLVAHYPEGWNLLGDPLCLRIQPRDPLACVRILHVAQSVPNQTADVELVVQDSGAAFRVPVNRARAPGSPERSGDAIPIQPHANRLRCDSCNVFPEDAFDDRGFRWLDLSFTSGHGSTAQRLHHPIAVTESARRLATLDAPAQASMRLVRKVLQEQRVHRSLEPDVQVRDVALGERDDVDAGEAETLEEPGRVFLIAAEAIERFGEDDVEAAVQRVPHQRLESRAQKRCAGDRVIREFLHDRPALAGGELTADPELVCD